MLVNVTISISERILLSGSNVINLHTKSKPRQKKNTLQSIKKKNCEWNVTLSKISLLASNNLLILKAFKDKENMKNLLSINLTMNALLSYYNWKIASTKMNNGLGVNLMRAMIGSFFVQRCSFALMSRCGMQPWRINLWKMTYDARCLWVLL